MEPTALYDLISQAKAENKAVQLFSNHALDDLEFIIEPEHQVENKEGSVIKIDDSLIDLNHIMAAVIIPNRKKRLEKEARRQKEIWESYKPNKKGKR